MNQSLFVRESAVLPFLGATDLTDKEGYLVTLAGETATLSASGTVPAEGVILDGQVAAKKSAIGILGALPGTVRLKCHAAITKGDRVMQFTDGTIVTDVGPGTARVSIGIACEDGAADELIEVATYTPMILP